MGFGAEGRIETTSIGLRRSETTLVIKATTELEARAGKLRLDDVSIRSWVVHDFSRFLGRNMLLLHMLSNIAGERSDLVGTDND